MTRRQNRPLRVEAEPAFRTRHANPYNARLYTAMQEQGVEVRDLSYMRLLLRRTDIVHLHWPELTFLSGNWWRTAGRLTFFFLFLAVARLRGTRVLWTVHNLDSHEKRAGAFARRVYRRLLLGNVDAILCLSNDGVAATRDAYPELAEVPAFVTPHGHYRHDYDFTASRAEARTALGLPLEPRMLVSVGLIRPYKNVPALIEAFRSLPEAQELLLGIAGKPARGPLAEEIRAARGDDERVRLELEFLSNERVALWLRAADMVVLPYSKIQNSGSAILALSADRPALVPDLGAMAELALSVDDEWLRVYEGEFGPSVLADAMSWLETTERPERADLAAMEWDAIAASTVDAYRATLSSPRPRS